MSGQSPALRWKSSRPEYENAIPPLHQAQMFESSVTSWVVLFWEIMEILGGWAGWESLDAGLWRKHLAPDSWLLPGTHEVRQKTSITRSCCPISCLSTLLKMWNQVTRNGILWNLELRKHLFVFTLSMSGVWAQWRKSWYRCDWVSHDRTNERMRITRCVQISSKPVQR